MNSNQITELTTARKPRPSKASHHRTPEPHTTLTEAFDFSDSLHSPKYVVFVDHSDTEAGYLWRLRDSNDQSTAWTRFYQGILWMDGEFGKVGYLSEYWKDERNMASKPFLAQVGTFIGRASSHTESQA